MSTTDPLEALLAIRDGYLTARWNFVDAVGTPLLSPGGIGNGVALSFSFHEAQPTYFMTSGFAAFSGVQRQAARDVLESISSAIDIVFTETLGTGQLAFGMNDQDDSAAYAFFPNFDYSLVDDTISSVQEDPLAGDVFFNGTIGWTDEDFAAAGSGYGTLVHELGHALGLKHPFEADTGVSKVLAAALDSLQYTVMSYTEHPHSLFRTVIETSPGSFTFSYASVQPETFMPLDLLALQYLYGANDQFNLGDDTYTFDPDVPFLRTLWDAGGNDTLSVANFSSGCVLDLREGAYCSVAILSDAVPAGLTDTTPGIYDGTDNLAIAYGVTIENAIGGMAADVLRGNAVANVLDGGLGSDVMEGGEGGDLYVVDRLGDIVRERADEGVDTVRTRISYSLRDTDGAGTHGANVENLELVGSAPVTGIGNALANSIRGNSASNVIDGREGDDTIRGLGGSDVIRGNSGDDDIDAGEGDDVITFGGSATGFDAIVGGAGMDELRALGSNAVIGLSSIDGIERITASGFTGVRIKGSSGSDYLDLSGTLLVSIAGIDGGTGDDTLVGSVGNDDITGGGGSGVDTVDGGHGDDTIYGNAGNDILRGGTGNDVFTFKGSNGGFDAIDGGSGHDELRALGNNTVFGLASLVGVETISASGFSGVQIRGSLAPDTFDFSGVTLVGISRIDGGAGDDTITGSNGGDDIAGGGGGGNDYLNGGDGDDVFRVGAGGGFDRFLGGAGFDTIRATQVDAVIGISEIGGIESISAGVFTGVTIFGTDAADTLDFSAVSLSGITLIDGGKGDDVIRGSATSNVIHGGAGMDTIEAGAGNDTIQFRGTALDVIDGGSGNDTVRAIADNASLIWSNVSHVERVDGTGYIGVKLLGTPAADALDFSAVTLLNVGLVDSGSGADAIVGSAGADVLKGGSGADGIAGGAGSDRFLYGATGESNPSEFDTISDFATGIDRIDLSAIDANTNSASHQSFSFIGAAAFNRTAGELRFDTGTAGVTRVLGDVDGNGAADMEIRLLGSHTLHASDFLGVV